MERAAVVATNWPIFMTALNSLASEEQVRCTPSSLDGIEAALEEELCTYASQQIQQAGILLSLPQAAMATAQVLFRRFWFVSSMKQFNVHDIGMGSLMLASKLTEAPVRLRDLLLVYDYLLQRAYHSSRTRPGPRLRTDPDAQSPQEAPPFTYRASDYYSQTFYDAKDAMVVAEMQILKRLGFYVQVHLPYALMINYLQVMGVASVTLPLVRDPKQHISAAQAAWNYLTDALQTPVYCLFPTHTIACASIYLLTLQPNALHQPLSLPLEPRPWWELFDVTRSELRTIASYILRLYDVETASVTTGTGVGLAVRVREQHGGLVELANRAGIRAWLQQHGTTSEI